MYNIFISHAWKYHEDYSKIVSWLDEAEANGELEWRNYSVPEHSPLVDPETYTGKRKLEKELLQQIRPASIVIALAGVYASYSDWIGFEIDAAAEMGKTIIGVKPRGNKRVSLKISENAKPIVNWNKNSLIGAINGAIKNID